MVEVDSVIIGYYCIVDYYGFWIYFIGVYFFDNEI